MILLWVWIVAWTACGISIIYEMLQINSNESKIFLIVFSAFWVYFEYKIGYAFFWRKKGKEIIRIAPDKLFLKRDISGRGRELIFESENIRKLKSHQTGEWDFFKFINESYFMIAGEKVSFIYSGKEIKFGIQLSEEEVKKLLKFFKHNTKLDLA